MLEVIGFSLKWIFIVLGAIIGVSFLVFIGAIGIMAYGFIPVLIFIFLCFSDIDFFYKLIIFWGMVLFFI